MFHKQISRKYVGGSNKMHHEVRTSLRRHLTSGAGIRPHGTGITPHGAGDRIPNPSGAGPVDKWFKQAGKDIGKFLTSSGVRKTSKVLRGIFSPLVKNLLPAAIDAGTPLLSAIPGVGPALSVAATALKPQIKSGLLKGIDAGNQFAESKGYGMRGGRSMVGGGAVQGVDLTDEDIRRQSAKPGVALDKHSISLLDGIIGSKKTVGRGLARM